MPPAPFREAPTPPIARCSWEGGAHYPDLRIGGDQSLCISSAVGQGGEALCARPFTTVGSACREAFSGAVGGSPEMCGEGAEAILARTCHKGLDEALAGTVGRSACREGFAQPQVAYTGAVADFFDARPATYSPLPPRFHPPATSPTLPAAALRLLLHPPPSPPSALPRLTSAFSRPTPHHRPPVCSDEPTETIEAFSRPEPRRYPAASSADILMREGSPYSCLVEDTSSGEDASPSGESALTAILVHPSHYPDACDDALSSGTSWDERCVWGFA
jgi:hypothetical protein